MKMAKIIKTDNGETRLPEDIIQHIQFLLSNREAARTAILSKSWYKAWSTRPALDFDCSHFCNRSGEFSDMFKEFSTKTMRRYLDSNLKIESFRLRSTDKILSWTAGGWDWVPKLIDNAMKIGATDVDIEFPGYTLGKEVLGSQNLVKLYVRESKIKTKYVSCSRLKSLSLKLVGCNIERMISCCDLLEELSLSECFSTILVPLRLNMYQIYKLRRLLLHDVSVDTEFFTDFGSRFPCLKDLSLHGIYHCIRVDIASTSLETISFHIDASLKASFDVPNIRKFTYWGSILPRFSIDKSSHEWEYNVSITTYMQFNKLSWFLTLKKLLTKFRPSKISLAICLQIHARLHEHEVDIEVVANPVVVENLRIKASSSFCCALLVRLFGICRPKFITLYRLTDECDCWCLHNECSHWSLENDSLDILCKRLMQQVITPNSGIPDQNTFGQFGLKKVNLEVYEMIYTKWCPVVLKEPLDASKPPVSKQKIQFELIWD